MRIRSWLCATVAVWALAAAAPVTPAVASSHMDAPLITFDDAANTTDVYAFRSDRGGVRYLTLALGVYPFEEPGIGPNAYRFDDRVIYDLHVTLGPDNIAAGRQTLTYRFRFSTVYLNRSTILQVYLGPVAPNRDASGFFANQNLRQSYTVTRIDNRTGEERLLGRGIVPPNNQGLLTPFYNAGNDGDRPARGGVAREADLDPYTREAIAVLDRGYRAFAGQRDDGFYADIQSIFDLDFSFGRATGTPTKPFDSQGGFNVHTIALEVPLADLGPARVAGVFATTSRRIEAASLGASDAEPEAIEGFRQVGRQGNPLFAEALIAIDDKNAYNRTLPRRDAALFSQYAADPEINRLLGLPPADLTSIFIPDMIRVDLTTGPARLAGEPGFNRLGVFGGDTLTNAAGQTVAGGWPNGRRFGDDVVDIALIALGVPAPNPGLPDYDRVTANDITFNRVFPYAATPLNGRVHDHH
jgi:hypothetical protein